MYNEIKESSEIRQYFVLFDSTPAVSYIFKYGAYKWEQCIIVHIAVAPFTNMV